MHTPCVCVCGDACADLSHSQHLQAGASLCFPLDNSLNALFVDFASSFLCRFFFSTLLVLFYYPTWVDPHKPHPNRFLEFHGFLGWQLAGWIRFIRTRMCVGGAVRSGGCCPFSVGPGGLVRRSDALRCQAWPLMASGCV